MSYVNVGAFIDGTRPKSKAALKAALKATPEIVTFDVTDAFGPLAGKLIAADDPATWPGSAKLTLVGPDPFTRRNFYGTVTRSGSVVKAV